MTERPPSVMHDGQEKAFETNALKIEAIVNGLMFKAVIPYGDFARNVAEHWDRFGITSLEQEQQLLTRYALKAEAMSGFMRKNLSVLENPINQGEQEADFFIFNIVSFSHDQSSFVAKNKVDAYLFSFFLKDSLSERDREFVFWLFAQPGNSTYSMITPVEKSFIFLIKTEEENGFYISLLIANPDGFAEWLRQQGERGIHY